MIMIDARKVTMPGHHLQDITGLGRPRQAPPAALDHSMAPPAPPADAGPTPARPAASILTSSKARKTGTRGPLKFLALG